MLQPSPRGSGRSVETTQATPSGDDFDVTLDSESSTAASTLTTTSNNSSMGTTGSPLASSHDSDIPMSTSPGTPSRIEDGYTSDDSSLSYDSRGMPRLVCPAPFVNTKDGYASDDSCASHDSFISNVIRRNNAWPPKPYWPPERYILIPKKGDDRPSSPDKIGAVKNAYSSSRLETLPSELRIQILSSMPDLGTLHSVIRSSPTMHTQYLYARHKILSACLDRELDGFYVDAYANLKSRPIELGWARFNKTIDDFQHSYHGWLAAPDSYPCAKSLPPSRVRWMAAYHISVARPLVRQYGSWALQNLERGLLSAARINIPLGGSDSELSRNEEVRIFRALYRHDTYHHLFGQNMGNRCGQSEHEVGDNCVFFDLFAPWDTEAISCFDTFLREQWGYIFDRVRDDISPKAINFRHCGDIFGPDGSYDLYECRHFYQTGMISRGLKMIARFLTIHDHQDLVSAMERCLIDPGTDDSLLDNMYMGSQRRRWQDHPTAWDEAEQRGDRMSFAGDSLPPDGPPLAWVALWGGRYANFYGQFVPESPKRWGFVMWDARRWADIIGEDGLKDVFVEHWKANHEAVRYISHYTGWKPLDVETEATSDDA